MRKIKIMMMMPLFLAVSLFFAGCNQSASDDDDGPSVGGVPLPDEYLNGINVYGIADGISNDFPASVANTRSWTTFDTIQYTVTAGQNTALTLNAVTEDDVVYPLVPAGKALLLNAQGATIQPGKLYDATTDNVVTDDDNNNVAATIYVDGALYLTNSATLLVGGVSGSTANSGTIRLRNSGRLYVTQGTTLRYGAKAVIGSILLGNTPALLSGGIKFSAKSALDFTANADIIRIDPTDPDAYTNLRDIWASSSPADVRILQGSGISTTAIFDFPVTPDRKLYVLGGNLSDVPRGNSDGSSPAIVIQDGLEYAVTGNDGGRVLEHLKLEVNGILTDTAYGDGDNISFVEPTIRPYSIKIGPKGVLFNMGVTGLDEGGELVVEGAGTFGQLENNSTVGSFKNVSIASGATLVLVDSINEIDYAKSVDGTLILAGVGLDGKDNQRYNVNATVGGKLEYYGTSGETVTLNNAVLKDVLLAGGSAAVKANGAELKVNGSLELEGEASVLVGGSLAPSYAALELNDEISLTGGFTLRPVVSTTADAEVISTAAELVIDSAPVTIASTDTTVKDKGALLGNGKITFTNGGENSITDDNDVTTVFSEFAEDKFTLGAVKLVGSNSIGYAALNLEDASIVFGSTEPNSGVGLLSGLYTIKSGDPAEAEDYDGPTKFVLGVVHNEGTSTPHRGIGIGLENNSRVTNQSLILGPNSEIIFGGEGAKGDDQKYLLVGSPYATTRVGVRVEDGALVNYTASQFAIRGTGTSPAKISIPNFLVVGSLGVDNSASVTYTPKDLFYTDRFAYDATTPSYSSGELTVDIGGSLSVAHKVEWTWGPHSSDENSTNVTNTGGWTK